MSAIEDARATLRGYDMSFQVHEVLRRLIAEHEARVTPITDAQVEAAARAIWQEEREETEWPDLTESGRTVYRIMGRAALEAAREAS
jgi:hypothetical protein